MTSNTKTLLWVAAAGVGFYLLYTYTKSGRSTQPQIGTSTNTAGTGTNSNSGDFFGQFSNILNTAGTFYNDGSKIVNGLFGGSSSPSPSTNSGGNNQGSVPSGSGNASQSLSDLFDAFNTADSGNTDAFGNPITAP